MIVCQNVEESYNWNYKLLERLNFRHNAKVISKKHKFSRQSEKKIIAGLHLIPVLL